MTELAFQSAAELAQKIKNRDMSSREMTEYFFERVDRLNGDINAIVVQVRDRALERADAADAALNQGEDWGPLHGVPMTVKESYNLAGVPTTWGEPAWKDNVPDTDALAVQRLENTGAVVFGKTNVPLMLADFQSYNDVYGSTSNPFDHSRNAGGSSGGSAAALAAGLTGLEIGSDIGGSIRNPAHYCGVFGHKPTWNLLPMRGHSPPGDIRTPSDISVIGPLARSAPDLATVVNAVAGPDAIMGRGYELRLPTANGRTLADFKVAVWSDDTKAPVDAEVSARVELIAQAFRDAGAVVDAEARPAFSSEHTHSTYENLLHATMAMRMPDDAYESLKNYVAGLDPNDQSDSARVFRAQLSTFRDWGRHNEARNHLRWAWHEFFQNYDLLLAPIMATAAFTKDEGDFGDRTVTVNNELRPYFEQVFWAGLTGVSYLPSTVIPTGLNDRGLPIGIQIVGPEYGDLITIHAAGLLEAEGFSFTPPPGY